MFIYNADNFIIKKRINLGDFFKKAPEKVYIELREPDTGDLIELQKAQGEDKLLLIKTLSDLLPKVLVDHNFYRSESEPLEDKEVISIVANRTRVMMRVLSEYMEVVFLSMGQTPKNPTQTKSAEE